MQVIVQQSVNYIIPPLWLSLIDSPSTNQFTVNKRPAANTRDDPQLALLSTSHDNGRQGERRSNGKNNRRHDCYVEYSIDHHHITRLRASEFNLANPHPSHRSTFLLLPAIVFTLIYNVPLANCSSREDAKIGTDYRGIRAIIANLVNYDPTPSVCSHPLLDFIICNKPVVAQEITPVQYLHKYIWPWSVPHLDFGGPS